jgi:hypothetical protein
MNQLAFGHWRFHWSNEGMRKNRDADEDGEGDRNTN